MNPPTDGESLLALWERAVAAPAATRGDALLQALEEDAAPPRSLGERNLRLAAMHRQLFGRDMELRSRCPACGTVAQFSADCEALAAPPADAPLAASHRLCMSDHEVDFRLPDGADVAAAACHDDEERFARELLARCVVACVRGGAPVPVAELPAEVFDALSRRIEALDPQARVSFAVECPQCATPWDARLDLGQLLWQKVQAAAEGLLLDVDALARRYGWTETDVLRLSATRRAAYLQMAAA